VEKKPFNHVIIARLYVEWRIPFRYLESGSEGFQGALSKYVARCFVVVAQSTGDDVSAYIYFFSDLSESINRNLSGVHIVWARAI